MYYAVDIAIANPLHINKNINREQRLTHIHEQATKQSADKTTGGKAIVRV